MNADEAIVNLKAVSSYWLSCGKTRPFFSASVETLANEVERLRAELAEAKAASAVPVKVDGVYVDSPKEVVVLFEETGKAEQFADWLRKMKERNNEVRTI